MVVWNLVEIQNKIMAQVASSTKISTDSGITKQIQQHRAIALAFRYAAHVGIY